MTLGAPVVGVASKPGVQRTDAPNLQRSAAVVNAPSMRVVHAYAIVLPVPDPSGRDVYNTGDAAWFKLLSISPATMGDEFALISGRVELYPTDNAGLGVDFNTGLIASPWGDELGISSHLVIGRNLPGQLGGMTFARADLPGIEYGDGVGWTRLRNIVSASNVNDATHTIQDVTRKAEYLAAVNFPNGTFNGAVTFKRTEYLAFAGSASKFAQGETLDVCIATRGSSVDAIITEGNLLGYMRASLVLASVTPDSRFTQ